jgi:Domain of unknown function (DUF1735)/Domain of unknown function (DUF4361)
MKNMKRIFLSLAVMAATMTLNSCLEDTGYLNIFNGENSGAVVSFGQDAYWQAGQSHDARSFDILATPQDMNIPVNVARGKADVTVTIAIDQASLTAYNAQRAAAGESIFELLPPSTYTIGALDLNIPSGTLDQNFTVKVNTSLMDLSKKFILPLKITAATNAVVASNFSIALFAVVVKNPYEGDYISTGTRYNFAVPANYTGWDNTNNVALGTNNGVAPWTFNPYYVNTVDATTSRVHAGNSDGGFGEFYFTVNPDNTITILDGTTESAGGLISFGPLPGRTSTYNPTTKTFEFWYNWMNTSGNYRAIYHRIVRK